MNSSINFSEFDDSYLNNYNSLEIFPDYATNFGNDDFTIIFEF